MGNQGSGILTSTTARMLTLPLHSAVLGGAGVRRASEDTAVCQPLPAALAQEEMESLVLPQPNRTTYLLPLPSLASPAPPASPLSASPALTH